MHELGLVGRAPRRRCRTTNGAHPYPRHPHLVAGLAVTQPDAVRVADSTSVRWQRAFAYRAVLMDVYSWTSTRARFAAGN
jgi:putative transposase